MHSYHLQAKGFEVSACIVMEVDLVTHSQAVDDLPDSDPSSFSPNFNWPNGDLGVAGETKRKSNHSRHCLTDSFYMLQLDGWWLQFKSLNQIVYHVNFYALYALSHFSVHWVNWVHTSTCIEMAWTNPRGSASWSSSTFACLVLRTR